MKITGILKTDGQNYYIRSEGVKFPVDSNQMVIAAVGMTIKATVNYNRRPYLEGFEFWAEDLEIIHPFLPYRE